MAEILMAVEPLKIYGQDIAMHHCRSDDLARLFSLTKKFVNILRKGAFGMNRGRSQIDSAQTRLEILHFLTSLDNNCDQLISNELGSFVFTEVQFLLLFTGRLSCQNESFISEVSTVQSNGSEANYYFDLLINLWRISLQILFKINKHLGTDKCIIVSNYTSDFRTQLIELIVTDAVLIALQVLARNDNIRGIAPEAFNAMFPFFSFVRELVEKGDVLIDAHPFWFHCNKFIESFDHLDLQLINIQLEYDPDLVRLWLVSFLMQMFNTKGVVPMNEPVQTQYLNCNPIVGRIVTSILKKDEAIRSHNSHSVITTMNLCLKIVKYCDPCVDFILPLIDYFMRCFYTASGSSTFRIMPKSSYQWYKKLELRLKGSLTDSEDLGLNYFIYLLDQVLNKLVNDNSDRQRNAMIQRIKGRFYSKLQPKKIEELSSTHLFNLISVLIVLCYSFKIYWSDVGEKLCDIVKIIYTKSLISERTSMLFKGLFSAIYLIQQDRDPKQLIDAAVGLFNKLVEALSTSGASENMLSAKRSLLIDLIFDYLEEFKAIIQWQSFPGCNQLISHHVIVLFNKLMDREKLTLFKFIESYLTVLRNNIENKVLLEDASNYFLPYFKSQFVTKQAQFDVTRISATLVILTLFKEAKFSPNEFRGLVMYFAGNPRVDVENLLKFSEVIFKDTDEVVEQHVEGLFPDFIERLFRCDEVGQLKIRQVLSLLLDCVSRRKISAAMDPFLPALKDFTRRYLGHEPPSRIIKTLDICVSIAPEIKDPLARIVLSAVEDLEDRRGQGPDDTVRSIFARYFTC